MKSILKKRNAISISGFFSAMLLAVPLLAHAADLVPCNGTTTPCSFDALLALINNVIKFMLFDLSMPFAAILFAYAGIILLTSGGSGEKRNKAKSIFLNVFIGFVIALAAWLIVETVIHALGYNGAWIGF